MPDSLAGKRVAVIGGTNGLGRAIALEFIAKGAEVLVVGRTFRDQGIPRLRFLPADLSEIETAQSLAEKLPVETLDILLMTHGIFAGKPRRTNAAGIELDLATSSLSRVVILREVADRMGKNRVNPSARPRIFVWGFPGGKRTATLNDLNSEQQYRWSVAHSNGVVVNEALVLDSAVRYPSVNFYGMNPGIISTDIMTGVFGKNAVLLKLQQAVVGLLFQSAPQYARRIAPLLVSADLEPYSGAMFGRHGDPILSNPVLADQSYLERVMAEAEKLLSSANRKAGK